MNPQTRKRQNLTAVYAALLQLMSQKPLSRISITELCQHARVSRTYFYRNFANFDQIILAYQKQTILQYLRQLPRQSKVKLQVLMTQYFTLMQQMAATNALLIKNEKIQIFIQSFEAVFALLIKQDRIIGSSNTALRQPYYTAYFSGAVINMLVHWQQNGMVETPAYLAQQVTRFTLRDNESRS
ncbi:TetR/AcrR family transcriptional regulator [Lactiplantibacillus plantarum]|uniref:TetR/AcrR family transcriptional regulator n=1 Tax=Lactiplantibacillus plantarum TaxID=1590 RepID=UPI0034E24B59